MVTKNKNILITGANGQLGMVIKEISYQSIHKFYFRKKTELDISNIFLLQKFIKDFRINCIINCAAYTDVEKSESEKELANKINHFAVDNIAKLCSKYSVQLIHISTDYVFDGENTSPYFEDDITKPVNFYGKTKLGGENKILTYSLKNSAIIRTSLLYSQFGNNFVKRIVNQINKGENFSVVDKLYCSPTNAFDLSKAIFILINKLKNEKAEIYHFSNRGTCSRYDLACEINTIIGGKSIIKPSKKIIGKAKRPIYSILNTDKLHNKFNLEQIDWKTSLKKYLKKTKALVNEI